MLIKHSKLYFIQLVVRYHEITAKVLLFYSDQSVMNILNGSVKRLVYKNIDNNSDKTVNGTKRLI